MARSTLFSILLVLLFGCNPASNTPKIAFYYWKTTYQLSPQEVSLLNNLEVKRLYIRFFDVDIDHKTDNAIPISAIRFAQKVDSFEVIPVIYLKNRLFLSKKLNIKDLASRIHALILQIGTKQQLTFNEIQFDCDWTLKSRDNFLRFIEVYKSDYNANISATIRLHQVKHHLTTSVPNVESGTLMYYNMGRIGADSLNSIYDRNIAKQYISSLKSYPLPLKVALPIFSWGVQSRDGKVIDLISKVNSATFDNDTNFMALKSNIFTAKNGTIKGGSYFRERDVVKIETVSPADLKEMATDLGQHLKECPKEIIFYDLDTTNLNNYRYDNQLFKEIATRF